MCCCRVNRCCFCFPLPAGVKATALGLMALEVCLIVFSALHLPEFLFAVAPTSAIGICCHALLLVAVFRSSRWFILPWLIYEMILIVGLGLAAVLRIVIPLGSPGSRTSTEWLEAAGTSAGCLAAAAFLLYLWIVVLELFIRLGPPPMMMPPPPQAYYYEAAAAAAAAPYPTAIAAVQLQQQPPPPLMQQQQQQFYQPASLVYHPAYAQQQQQQQLQYIQQQQ